MARPAGCVADQSEAVEPVLFRYCTRRWPSHVMHGLARHAADQDVGRRHGAGAHLAGDRGHAAQVGHAGVTVGEHGARERLDFGEPRGFEAEGLPGEAHGLDAAAHAAVQQWRGLGRTA
ncbi:hypothetical protein ABB33_15405 [Stenotrophomonas acidaminiphila]|nr:hypothetical protein ABB33_15405 [Stenotrophomonas acidaminiphila]